MLARPANAFTGLPLSVAAKRDYPARSMQLRQSGRHQQAEADRPGPRPFGFVRPCHRRRLDSAFLRRTPIAICYSSATRLISSATRPRARSKHTGFSILSVSGAALERRLFRPWSRPWDNTSARHRPACCRRCGLRLSTALVCLKATLVIRIRICFEEYFRRDWDNAARRFMTLHDTSPPSIVALR